MDHIDKLVMEWQDIGPRPGGIHRLVQEVRDILAAQAQLVSESPVFTEEHLAAARAQLEAAQQQAAETMRIKAAAHSMVVAQTGRDSLHMAIMNLSHGPAFNALTKGSIAQMAYKEGHKDARHGAAELIVGSVV